MQKFGVLLVAHHQAAGSTIFYLSRCLCYNVYVCTEAETMKTFWVQEF